MKRTLKACSFLLAVLITAFQTAFIAEAKNISGLRLRVEGDIVPGQQLAESLPDVSESSSQYYIDYYEFANGTVVWDRKETPELTIQIYPEKGYRITTKTIKNIAILDSEGSYVSHEWPPNDEGSRGVSLRIRLQPLSTPGAETKKRREELFAEYDATLSTKKAKAAKESAIIPGWYKDGNGWWYCEEDASFPISQWKELDGQFYYFNENGYMCTGWFEVSGLWYYADSDGALLTNTTTPDGHQVDANGVWVQ